jgi:hypothetical protein
VIGVCFTCAQRAELVPDHHVCEACHDPARCRRFACVQKRSGTNTDGTVKKKFGTGSIYKWKCMEALASLGGFAKTGEIAREAGYTSPQVALSLRASKGVTYVPDPTTNKPGSGHWRLETEESSESIGFFTSEAQTA